MGNIIWVVIAIIVLFVLYVIMAFNALVRGRNQVSEAWSDIETHLKRRYDLIPNLVETVKGYVKHESETLEKVVQARSVAMSQSGGAENHTAAENALGRTLKSIFALSESYPDLKANQNFIELQREITDTEDKIQASRRFYNSNVLALNSKIEMFPSNIIAGIFKFVRKPMFEVEAQEERQNVKVQF